MEIEMIAVGTKMPDWVRKGVEEYGRRLPAAFKLIVSEIPLGYRSGKQANTGQAVLAEGKAMLEKLAPGSHVVALDVKGRQHTTEQLASRINGVRESGKRLVLLVGGPDGLARECLDAADEIWSLSALTLPHTIVRIVVAEQLYRVWSILNGHPYHRE